MLARGVLACVCVPWNLPYLLVLRQQSHTHCRSPAIYKTSSNPYYKTLQSQTVQFMLARRVLCFACLRVCVCVRLVHSVVVIMLLLLLLYVASIARRGYQYY